MTLSFPGSQRNNGSWSSWRGFRPTEKHGVLPGLVKGSLNSLRRSLSRHRFTALHGTKKRKKEKGKALEKTATQQWSRAQAGGRRWTFGQRGTPFSLCFPPQTPCPPSPLLHCSSIGIRTFGLPDPTSCKGSPPHRRCRQLFRNSRLITKMFFRGGLGLVQAH